MDKTEVRKLAEEQCSKCSSGVRDLLRTTVKETYRENNEPYTILEKRSIHGDLTVQDLSYDVFPERLVAAMQRSLGDRQVLCFGREDLSVGYCDDDHVRIHLKGVTIYTKYDYQGTLALPVRQGCRDCSFFGTPWDYQDTDPICMATGFSPEGDVRSAGYTHPEWCPLVCAKEVVVYKGD